MPRCTRRWTTPLSCSMQRDRVLAGELLHVVGALRSSRAWVVVPHQALRQVQGLGSIPALHPSPLFRCLPRSCLSCMPNWWMQIVQKTFVKEADLVLHGATFDLRPTPAPSAAAAVALPRRNDLRSTSAPLAATALR